VSNRWLDIDPKEAIKLLLLLGTIAAGCQINRHEIREVEESNFEDVAVLQDSISILNRRVTALEKQPHRKIRRTVRPKPGLFARLFPFFGG
jgi:ribosomal protein S18